MFELLDLKELLAAEAKRTFADDFAGDLAAEFSASQFNFYPCSAKGSKEASDILIESDLLQVIAARLRKNPQELGRRLIARFNQAHGSGFEAGFNSQQRLLRIEVLRAELNIASFGALLNGVGAKAQPQQQIRVCAELNTAGNPAKVRLLLTALLQAKMLSCAGHAPKIVFTDVADCEYNLPQAETLAIALLGDGSLPRVNPKAFDFKSFRAEHRHYFFYLPQTLTAAVYRKLSDADILKRSTIFSAADDWYQTDQADSEILQAIRGLDSSKELYQLALYTSNPAKLSDLYPPEYKMSVFGNLSWLIPITAGRLAAILSESHGTEPTLKITVPAEEPRRQADILKSACCSALVAFSLIFKEFTELRRVQITEVQRMLRTYLMALNCYINHPDVRQEIEHALKAEHKPARCRHQTSADALSILTYTRQQLLLLQNFLEELYT